MNYLPFVSWGMYAGAGIGQTTRGHFFVSWGMMESLPGAVIDYLIPKIMYLYRRMRGI